MATARLSLPVVEFAIILVVQYVGCSARNVSTFKLTIQYIIQGGPKVGIQLLKVGFGSKSRFVVLM